MHWTLEVVIVPVSDIDRAKAFYADQVGFVVDHDIRINADARIVQLTPPGSGCSIVIGSGAVPDMPPGSLRGLQLVVADIHRARAELVERGVQVSEVQVLGDNPQPTPDPLDDVGFVFFSDPDGNAWAVQQISSRAYTRRQRRNHFFPLTSSITCCASSLLGSTVGGVQSVTTDGTARRVDVSRWSRRRWRRRDVRCRHLAGTGHAGISGRRIARRRVTRGWIGRIPIRGGSRRPPRGHDDDADDDEQDHDHHGRDDVRGRAHPVGQRVVGAGGPIVRAEILLGDVSLRVLQCRLVEVGARRHRAAQVGAGEIRLTEVAVGEIGIGQRGRPDVLTVRAGRSRRTHRPRQRRQASPAPDRRRRASRR